MEYYSFFNPDSEKFDDQKTYDLIARGENLGLFQIETVPMINFCKQFKPNSLDDLSSVLAILRPDTMPYITDILKNKENPDEIVYIHPDMQPILNDTHGVLLYQEQLIEIVKKFGGFTGGQADLFRRAIGKKKPEEVKMWAEKFKEGGLALGYPSEVIETLYNDLSDKGGYLFNKSHSVSYAMLTYLTGYLKANHPLEFMCSTLANQKKDDGTVDYETLSKYLIECRRIDIKITEPDINLSQNTFSIIGNGINFGIGLIKGVGCTEQEKIFECRPFSSFKDYLIRCSSDKTSVVSLIKAGAFNCFSTDKKKLLSYFFAWRYKNGKESQKPLTKMNKTIISDMLNQGIISHNDIDEKTGKAKYPEVMLEIVNEKRKRLFAEAQMNELGNLTEIEWQFEVLNTYLGDTPFTNVELPNWNIVIPSRNNTDNAYIGGTITAINKKVGKNGRNKGRPFAFVSLDTEYGKIELSIFADAYAKYIDLIERSKCIVCLGKKDSESSMIVSYIETLAHYRERTGL